MPKDAGRLQCPSCGVPVRGEMVKCLHCGTKLATVACPSCFAVVFRGAKFCAHCGSALQHSDAQRTELPCPRCKPGVLGHLMLGSTPVHECAQCHGLWVDAAIFEQICTDRERQSAALGRASQAFQSGSRTFEANVRYVPCPFCSKLMNRLNFAKCSGIIVDVCRAHGTWFDRDELQHIVEFVRGGGMDAARAKEKAELEAARRRLELERQMRPPDSGRSADISGFDEFDLISIAGSLIRSALD